MSQPKAVVFDLGNVLLDFDYGKAARGMLPHCDVNEQQLHAAMNQSTLLHKFESGELSNQQFFEEIKAAAKFREDINVFRPLFCDIFSPVPAMIELNERLRKATIPTFIFSNTNGLQLAFIQERFPFFGRFSGYILSFEHKAMKPNARIYQVVERTTGHAGHNLLYIDDRLENVQQGVARGWQTIHHKDITATIQTVETLFGLKR
jgi:HAD superfamily hydrolase (TIGR01509 family)